MFCFLRIKKRTFAKSSTIWNEVREFYWFQAKETNRTKNMRIRKDEETTFWLFLGDFSHPHLFTLSKERKKGQKMGGIMLILFVDSFIQISFSESFSALLSCRRLLFFLHSLLSMKYSTEFYWLNSILHFTLHFLFVLSFRSFFRLALWYKYFLGSSSHINKSSIFPTWRLWSYQMHKKRRMKKTS